MHSSATRNRWGLRNHTTNASALFLEYAHDCPEADMFRKCYMYASLRRTQKAQSQLTLRPREVAERPVERALRLRSGQEDATAQFCDRLKFLPTCIYFPWFVIQDRTPEYLPSGGSSAKQHCSSFDTFHGDLRRCLLVLRASIKS